MGLEKKALSTTLPSLTPFSPSLEDFPLPGSLEHTGKSHDLCKKTGCFAV